MRFYRLLLRCFPASFRAEYGDEMSTVFAARRREEPGVVLWATTCHDVITNALRVHADLLWQDLRWTFRVLRRSPAFALTAVLVAALGMGATTAAFTLLNHVLIRPLPFPHAEELVMLYQAEPAKSSPRNDVTPPNFEDWRDMSGSFSVMGAYIPARFPLNLSGHGEPVRVDGIMAGADVFRTLAVGPAVGRGFTAEDERDGADPVVLLSHGMATTLFGGTAAAVGTTVRLDDRSYTIVGVMASGFAFPYRDIDVWMPIRGIGPAAWASRTNYMLNVVARLRPGLSVTRARADMDVVAARLERAYPKDNADVSVAVVELRDIISPEARTLVLAVFGAAFCLMLIACTNLANLLFARAIQRRQEVAVRVAIGAGRERLVRQLFTESAVLAIAGGALGLLLALVVTPSLALLIPTALPIEATPAFDWRVLAFAAALTVATTMAFGAGPVWRSSRRADVNALRSRSTAGHRADRLRAALVLAEVAGTVVLLVGAGLLLKAMWRVQAVDPGFRTAGVVTLRTAPPTTMAADARREFYARVLSEARALPGVTSAAYVSFLPMTSSAGNLPVVAPGVTLEEETRAHIRSVTPDYFRTLGIPLLDGRDVRDGDDSTAPPVAVVSHSLAQRLWPGQDPIGREVTLGLVKWTATVVGVVGDVAVRGLEQDSLPQAYFPSDQIAWLGVFYAPKDLVLRASGDPASLVPALRTIVRGASPEQAISDVRLLEELVASQTASRRVQVRVLASFGAVAFLLAAVGIHGLLSFAVSMRTQEVGVRLALGATRRDVWRLFLRQGVSLGLAGVAVALPLAYAAARGMTALLFGVQPGDPPIYAVAALLALLMTLAGSVHPALRAASVDPAITLRSD